MQDTELIYRNFLHFYILSVKESYTAQNSLELKLPSRPSYHHSVQNKELSPLKKGMDFKIDYIQLTADTSLRWSQELLIPAVES